MIPKFVRDQWRQEASEYGPDELVKLLDDIDELESISFDLLKELEADKKRLDFCLKLLGYDRESIDDVMAHDRGEWDAPGMQG
jgi:hypothetical protein